MAFYGDCCCGKDSHPTPCFSCRARAGLCECCGAPGDDCYPYGVYCDACWLDCTADGICRVQDGREHRQAHAQT